MESKQDPSRREPELPAPKQDSDRMTMSGIDRKKNVIPESLRPDGSVRPARKIRPGFIPCEDAPKYIPPRLRVPNDKPMQSPILREGKKSLDKDQAESLQEAMDKLCISKNLNDKHHPNKTAGASKPGSAKTNARIEKKP